MKACVLTRYSTGKQKPTSTEDQLRNCKAFAKREGMTVVKVCSDQEISGAVRSRPGYLAMLEAAEQNEFDILLVDDLSRLARDAIEQGLTLKRLKFLGIRVVGVSEGYDSEAPGEKIHAAVKGLLNELYIDNIRFQTRRGLEGRVLDGMSAGGRAYGYRSTPVVDNGNTVGHRLVINEDEARTIRQIHHWFADGVSPMEIAARLNERGVPSPRGGMWARSAIHGDPRDGTGILNNSLYDGRMTWNRARYITDPNTNKRVRKVNDESLWVVVDLPNLRIVPADLWVKVKARQASISKSSKDKQRIGGSQARTGAGPKYLLSGLLKCGECGSNYIIVDRYRYGCARHKDRGAVACSNETKVDRLTLENAILSTLKRRLLTPHALEQFKCDVADEAASQLSAAEPDQDRGKDRLLQIDQHLSRLIESIKAGIDPALIRDEINRLHDERKMLEQTVARSRGSAPHAAQVIDIAIARYDELIANLQHTLQKRTPEARELLKSLLGSSIELTPIDNGTAVETKMAGHSSGLSALLASTPGLATQSEINVVAGAGLEPATFGL